MKKSPYTYNVIYELMAGRWGTPLESISVASLAEAEAGVTWIFGQPEYYLERIRKELPGFIERLPNQIDKDQRINLMIEAHVISCYTDVCAVLDQIEKLTEPSES